MAMIAEAVRHMLAAGMQHDAIVSAIIAMESQSTTQVIDIKTEERRRRDRERKAIKKLSDGIPQNSMESVDSAECAPLDGFNGFPDPSLTSLNPPKEKPPKGGKQKNPEVTDLFSQFWEVYPKTRAGSKDKARIAWTNALKRSAPTEILDGVASYCESEEVASGFAKGAAAWLNDDRWTSEYSRSPPAYSRSYQASNFVKSELDEVFKYASEPR